MLFHKPDGEKIQKGTFRKWIYTYRSPWARRSLMLGRPSPASLGHRFLHGIHKVRCLRSEPLGACGKRSKLTGRRFQWFKDWILLWRFASSSHDRHTVHPETRFKSFLNKSKLSLPIVMMLGCSGSSLVTLSMTFWTWFLLQCKLRLLF